MDEEAKELLRHISAGMNRLVENTSPPNKVRRFFELIALGAAVGGIFGLVLQAVEFFWGSK